MVHLPVGSVATLEGIQQCPPCVTSLGVLSQSLSGAPEGIPQCWRITVPLAEDHVPPTTVAIGRRAIWHSSHPKCQWRLRVLAL